VYHPLQHNSSNGRTDTHQEAEYQDEVFLFNIILAPNNEAL
jgi:hypothetical protein